MYKPRLSKGKPRKSGNTSPNTRCPYELQPAENLFFGSFLVTHKALLDHKSPAIVCCCYITEDRRPEKQGVKRVFPLLLRFHSNLAHSKWINSRNVGQWSESSSRGIYDCVVKKGSVTLKDFFLLLLTIQTIPKLETDGFTLGGREKDCSWAESFFPISKTSFSMLFHRNNNQEVFWVPKLSALL